MNVASKKLHDPGIAVVFSGGNAGPGPGTDPAGASDCSPSAPAPDPVMGSTCKTNPWGLSPWGTLQTPMRLPEDSNTKNYRGAR